MILLFHIISASVSVIFSTVGVFSPSRAILNITYVFIATTVISGTALIFEKNVSLAHVCMTGLIYLAITLTEVYITNRKLAAKTTE